MTKIVIGDDDVVILFFRGYDTSMISYIFDIPEADVYNRMSRVREKRYAQTDLAVPAISEPPMESWESGESL